MKGTIVEFLKLAGEKPELARDLVVLAAKHDFQFTDELSDDQLDGVAGGIMSTLMAITTSAYDAVGSDSKNWISYLANQNEVAEAMGDYLKDLNDQLNLPPTKS